MDMIWIVLYGSLEIWPVKEIAGNAFYMIYEIHLKEGPCKFKMNFMEISAPFEIPIVFSFICIVSGTRLVLGVEDCKDPKFLKNLKFLFIIILARQGRNCKKLRGRPKFFV